MSDILSLAALNLLRAPARSAAVFVYLAALSAVLFTGGVLYFGVLEASSRGAQRLGADAMVVPATRGDDASDILLSETGTKPVMPFAIAGKVRAMPEVAAAAAQLYVTSGPLACCALSDVLLVGFEQDRDFTLSPWLRERIGRTLEDDEVIVGSDISAEPGGKIAFYGKLFRIAGKLEPAGVGKFDSTVFIPLSGARKMLIEAAKLSHTPPSIGPDDISAVMVRIKPGVNRDAAALSIESRLQGAKVVLAGRAVARLRESMLGPVYGALASAAVQWASGVVMIAAMFGFALRSRRAEIALMRAMGARLRDVRRMVLIETLILGVSASLAGLMTGGLVLWAIRGAYSMQMASALPGALIAMAVAGLTVLTALGSSLYPLRRANTYSPQHATTPGH